MAMVVEDSEAGAEISGEVIGNLRFADAVEVQLIEKGNGTLNIESKKCFVEELRENQ